MARQKDNLVMQGAAGHIGKQLVFKKYRGGTVISKYPDMSKIKKSEKQRVENSLFRNAVAFAKAAKADPALITDPDFKVKEKQSLYHAALSWYLVKQKDKPVQNGSDTNDTDET